MLWIEDLVVRLMIEPPISFLCLMSLGNIFTDVFKGIELNPRIGRVWDLKLFHNGHCAMIGWTVMYDSNIRLPPLDHSY